MTHYAKLGLYVYEFLDIHPFLKEGVDVKYNLTKYYNAVRFDIKVNGLDNFALISLEPFFIYKLVP